MKTETEKQASKDIWIYIDNRNEMVAPKYLFTKESKYLNRLLNV